MDTHASLAEKEKALIDCLRDTDGVIVAYSGGVDSSLLAYYARKTLGDKAKIVIAVSASLGSEELEAARLQAAQFNWDLIEIKTEEVEKPEYQRNDLMRCYFCKSTLFEELDKIAGELKIPHVAYGANMDDLSDFRPGHKAAREHKVISPLQIANLAKPDIRELAQQAGLPSWDRPQAACLSSRFPTFEMVTAPALSRVDAAERFIHSLGFKQIRVRNHTVGTPSAALEGSVEKRSSEVFLARLEVDTEEMHRFSEEPSLLVKIDAHLKELGYSFVTLDMGGYRRGSGNVAGLEEAKASTVGSAKHG